MENIKKKKYSYANKRKTFNVVRQKIKQWEAEEREEIFPLLLEINGLNSKKMIKKMKKN